MASASDWALNSPRLVAVTMTYSRTAAEAFKPAEASKTAVIDIESEELLMTHPSYLVFIFRMRPTHLITSENVIFQ